MEYIVAFVIIDMKKIETNYLTIKLFNKISNCEGFLV